MSIRKNTVINLAGSIIPMLVMLVTVPLYLKVLGDARYGVLALVWLVLGYFSFLEMGLGKATANQIAKAHDAPAAERSEIFWTALIVNGVMGVVGAGILWLVGHYLLTNVLKMPEDFRQEALAALPWMVATFPLALASSVFNGALEGRNQFLTLNVLQVASNTVFQVAPLLVAYGYGPSLSIVIPAAVLSRAFMNIPFLMACYRALPLSLVPSFSIQRGKSLFSYGGWVAVAGMVSPVMETVDRFLIGAIVGAKAVAHYTIAYQLASKLRILPASLSRALFPRFSADTAEGGKLAQDSLSVLMAIMTPAVVLGILLVRPFLAWWVGEDVAQHAAPVAKIILVGVWANSLAQIPSGLIQGRGRPRVIANLQVAELLPFLVVLYVATRQWGVIGAASAWTLRVTADALLLYWLSGLPAKVVRTAWLPFSMVLVALLIGFINLDPTQQMLGGLVLTGWFAIWMLSTPLAQTIRTRFQSRITRNTR
jgi:O-antigen/teichoic acid export membrane protein